MAFIEVTNLCKDYKISKRQPGAFGAIKGLFSREYKTVPALSNVTFPISKGELVGYIGPNGAGKSTTIKILSGILVPSSGKVQVDGRDPIAKRREHVAQIGVVFGQRTQLWWDVPIIDSYNLLRDIYRVPKDAYEKRLEELCTTLSIHDLLDKPLRQLSLGQRMRCELVGSLLHSPKLLFLDEPTIGLDAVSKLAVREFLQKENKLHHTTMLLTTHDMDDIEALCSRVMIIGKGKLLYDGRMDTLLHKYSINHMLRIEYVNGSALPHIQGLQSMEKDGTGYKITYNKNQLSTHVLLELLRQGGEMKDISMQPQPIDEIIAHLYRELDI